MLSTAIDHIRYGKGNFHECKVLLDTESKPNLITEDLCRRLELPISGINMTVSGVDQIELNLKEGTRTAINSKFGHYETSLRCLVTSRITQCARVSPKDLENLFWDLLYVG